ncbi:DUF1120 domain-containing protein [Bordetella sp. 15P40C-2]|uniref:DUF1120 domain-containing protein n=1 Tax=Bordetella sp. 15P40C-2 TaxID=2572246 RepID=UPI0013267B6D|nr:DUF1120 domain-containing protein [Bordetella sp. 15P40C-2]MVW70699.1 DUF1120 domain-containing protein [Bordetella sp. 15P40C-2]
MKRTLISLCLAAASLAPVLATANSSAQLQVTGTIKPEACNISSSLAVVDLGETPFSKLNPDARTFLDKQKEGIPFTLNLTCSEKTMVGFRVIDNRAGTASYLGWNVTIQKRLFGLGSVSGVPLGSYILDHLSGHVVDGETATLGTCLKEASDCDLDGSLVPNELKVLINVHRGVVVPFKSATINLTVIGVSIRNSDLLPKGRRLKLDGSATIELVYL